MSDGPTIGMAMIVRDEAETITTCLESFWEHVDRVAIIDTGSKDDTIEVIRAFARERGDEAKLTMGTFEWIYDFGAARQAADELLPDVDWRSWVDADDIVEGPAHLRNLAAQAPPELAGYAFDYDYAQDHHGNCVCTLVRERLVRAGQSTWIAPVHEAQDIQGPVTRIPPELAIWRHRKPLEKHGTSARNIKILKKWLEREPENPRVLQYLGTEELTRGKPKRAVTFFRRYIKLKTGWDEERAQVYRKLAIAYAQLGRTDAQIATAFDALKVVPTWPDSYLTLAEAHHTLGEHDKAIEWCREVIRRGAPADTLLIINPLEYTVQPRVILAGSLGALGRIDEAIETAEEALKIIPDHEGLLHNHAMWRNQRKRENTADTIVSLAQVLVQHDEQQKALALLERAVPHFAKDHPNVVLARSQLRERLRALLDEELYEESYATGGPRPEEMVADDKVDEVGNALPRCGFLLDGLREQVA